MSDDFNRRTYAKMQQEIAESDNPRARYQAVLDEWVWRQREAAAEERALRRQADPYNLGLYDPP